MMLKPPYMVSNMQLAETKVKEVFHKNDDNCFAGAGLPVNRSPAQRRRRVISILYVLREKTPPSKEEF
jgi:hypothetical protein